MDKYLSKHRTRRIYTRTVPVYINQDAPEKQTRMSKNHFVSIIASSSPTKVTLECSDNTQDAPEKRTQRSNTQSPEKQTRGSKKHFVSIITPSSPTKVTLECSKNTRNAPKEQTHRSKKQLMSVIASSSPTKVTLNGPDDTLPFSNTWEGKYTKYRHPGNNKLAKYKHRTKTTINRGNINSNNIKHTPSNHVSPREGAIKITLPRKSGQKANTPPGESAITPVLLYQAEQITPPLAREGEINHKNHLLCPIELPTPPPNIRESAIKPTSSNNESSREGAIKNILPEKGGQKAHKLAGKSAITQILCQAEQITLPLAREGAINHINHKAL